MFLYCVITSTMSIGSTPKYRSPYGPGKLPIILADLACTGSEKSLLDCNRNTYGVLHCHSYEIAGVECEGIYFNE